MFDQGVWTTPYDPEAQLAKGHLRFELFGEKLKGEWHLVRSGKPARQPQWLLFKEDDAYAGKLEADDLLADVTPHRRAKKVAKKAAKTIAPKTRRKVDWAAKAVEADRREEGEAAQRSLRAATGEARRRRARRAQWMHEVKWDGYRLVATMVGGKVRIWSRNAIEWTDKVPEMRAALEQLGLQERRARRRADRRPRHAGGLQPAAGDAVGRASRARWPTCCSTCCTSMASTSARRRWSSARRCSKTC